MYINRIYHIGDEIILNYTMCGETINVKTVEWDYSHYSCFKNVDISDVELIEYNGDEYESMFDGRKFHLENGEIIFDELTDTAYDLVSTDILDAIIDEYTNELIEMGVL